MKRIVKQAISMLLCLVMLVSVIPAAALTGSAATVGSKINGDIGLDSGSFSTDDYIALPIEIYDYKADGMLFQYAEPQINGTYTIVNPPEIDLGWDFSDTSIKLPSGTGSGGVAVNTNFTVSYQQEGNRTSYLHAVRGSKGGSGEYIQLTLGNLGGVKASEMRYMAIRYRIRSGYKNGVGVYLYERDELTNQPYIICDYDNGMSMTGDGSWHTTVIDLAANTSDDDQAKVWSEDWLIDYVSMQPVAADGYIDIAYTAFFGNKADATAFNEKAVRTYTLDDNMAFGLLGSSRSYEGDGNDYITFRRISQTYYPGNSDHNTAGWYNENTNPFNGYYNTAGASSIWQIDDSRTTKVSGTEAYLGYNLIATIGGAATTAGLLDPTLSSEGYPVYKPETVHYIAKLLQATLPIKEKESSGTYPYNYDYVMGEEYDYDGDGDLDQLAQIFRDKITEEGTYEATVAKNLKGKSGLNNITSYMDAAYFLLNNLFVRDSYNIPDDTYHHLVLNSATVNGEQVYVFDAGFGDSKLNSSVKYENGIISNTAADSKPLGYYSSSETTTYYPFLPLTSTNNADGMTKTPYLVDDAAWNPNNGFNTYVNRNYNYVLRSHGEFTYREADDLFFQFEGDDDVYLFINGQLVLDIGGAHPIATQTINLNDYVADAIENLNNATKDHPASERDKALALVDGESYDFDFFYMERHGYGANMRIVTNMKIVDTDIDVEKDAYQDDIKLPDNGAIDINKPVGFSFTLHNTEGSTLDVNSDGISDGALFNLQFSDPRIGITLDYNNGLTRTANSRAVTSSGNPLTKDCIDLITFHHTDADGKKTSTFFRSNSEVMGYLKNLGGKGLEPGCSLEVRGIYVKMTEADFVKGPWVNTVTVDAMSNKGSGLRDTADVTLNNVLQPVYYMWAGHKLTVSSDMLKDDINEAIDNGTMGDLLTTKLASIRSFALTSPNGVPVTSNYVTVADGIATVNYTAPGTYLDHVQIAYTDVNNKTGTVILPIQTYVVDVEDEVFVLDYGLSVDLSAGGALTPNDILTVPGQSTTWFMEGIANNAPTYLHGTNGNHLSFEQDDFEGIYGIVVVKSGNGRWALNARSSGNITGIQVTTNTTVSASDIGNAQQFRISSAGNGYYTIWSCETGKYLTLGERSNQDANQKGQDRYFVSQENYTGADTQLWKFVENGKSMHIYNKASEDESVTPKGYGYCYLYYNTITSESPTEIISGAIGDGTGSYFNWELVKIPEHTGTYNGTYNLTMRWDRDQYAITVKDSSLDSNNRLCMWTLADSGNEAAFTFHLVETENGVDYYTIKSDATNKYLTSVNNNADVLLQDYVGDKTQLWAVTTVVGSPEYVHIQCKDQKTASSIYGLNGNSNTDGGTVTYYIVDNTKHAGQWKLNPVNGNSGEFSFDKNAQKLVYTPADFMEDAETTYLSVRVHETGFNPSPIGATDINHEVEMFKAITVIPANVVYYEDDFPAIKYYRDDKLWTGDIITDGSSGSLWQSNNQDEQYGHDDVYSDKQTDITTSGSSITKITIDDKTTISSTPAASFSFAGTGFELVGRTNASDSATIVIKVKDASGKQIKLIPVITEFDHDAETEGNTQDETIYQVPVIKVDNLDFGTYTVEIHGVASTSSGSVVPTYLYIDGIRIYNPLGGGNVTGLENEYIAGEKGAAFAEIRDLILTAEAGVVEWGDSMTVSTGISTYTENRIGEGWTGEYKGNIVSKPEDYLLLGPNNEVYLNGISSNQAIVLYVKETDASIATLQVGVHLVDNLAFFGGDVTGTATPGQITLGVMNGNKLTWETFHSNLTSGTEQYYTIDYKKCPVTSDGYYQVVLYVEDGMVSFTNLKYNGLTLKSTGATAVQLRYNANGLLEEYIDGEWVSVVNQESHVDYQLLSQQVRAPRMASPSTPDVPDVTEPEETEPEGTEPDETEPDNTKPGDSESEIGASVPMYRLYNPNSGEHFYTGSAEEKNNLVAAGWTYEGVAWNAPISGGDPVYRLYNPNSGDHHYTMSVQERDNLVAVGWKYEGVAWNSAPADAIPQYRLYNPNAACGSHHYTSSMEERENLVALGWIYEGIGWYGLLK